MDLDALKAGWQQQGPPGPEWTGREDMHALQQRTAALRRTAARRDLRESLAALAVAAIFGWLTVTPRPPLARAGAAIVVLAAVLVVIWPRVRAGRNIEPETDLPVAEYFRRELRYLDRQAQLLRSVWWWYILPNLIGVELFLLGTGGLTRRTAVFMAFPLLLAVAIYLLNRAAARMRLDPLRDEVSRLLVALEREATTACRKSGG